MRSYIVLDFETASSVDLMVAGGWRYSEDPTTEILCLAWQVLGGASDLWVPGMDTSRLLALANDPECIFIAHNAAFEKAIWRNIMVPVFGFPNVPNSRWYDTMAMCAMKALPQKLEGAANVLELGIEKDLAGSRHTIGLSKPNKKTGMLDRTADSLARVYAYCRTDVAAEVKLHERLGFLPQAERQVWLRDQRINERGVRLDLPFVKACEDLVEKARGPLAWEFRNLTKDMVPVGRNPKQLSWGLTIDQGAKFIQWAEKRGAIIPDMQKDTVDILLGMKDEDDSLAQPDNRSLPNVVLPNDVRRALEIRRLLASASIKKLPRMRACVCSDGRARGLSQYHGTAPGRKAGRLFQPHNFPRGTLRLGDRAPPPDMVVEAIMTGDTDFVSMVLGPPVEAVVSALRHCIVPERGRLLASGDYAGIQARVVLALAGQHDKTALMASGADVYCDMAEAIYKRPIDKRKDPEERQTGKNSVLGLGFQMGWKRFREKYAGHMTEEFCERIIWTYRNEWAPCVPKMWQALALASLQAVQSGKAHEAYGIVYQREDIWLTARLPSGRKLWYTYPKSEKRPMPWDNLDIRLGWSYQQQKMGRWMTIHAFGGLLTENVVMGIERDIMEHGASLLEANNFPVILDVHDEILTEPLQHHVDLKAMEQIMTDVEPWVRHLRIPVAVECWEGDRYKK